MRNEKLKGIWCLLYFKFKNNLVSASLKLNFHLLQISFFVPQAIVCLNREERKLSEALSTAQMSAKISRATSVNERIVAGQRADLVTIT